MANTPWEMSELEREFELEVDDVGADTEASADDEEVESDLYAIARDGEVDEDSELDEELDLTGDDTDAAFARRFHELSEREFESENELDESVTRLVNELEAEYFFKGLGKKLGSLGKSLVKKGLKVAAGMPALQAFKGISQLARGNLKGLIGTMAKAAMPFALSAIPGGAAVMPALKMLGFGGGAGGAAPQQAWGSFVDMAKNAFGNLAQNISSEVDDPLEASRVANDAFRSALKQVKAAPARRSASGPAPSPGGRVRRVRLRRGDRLVIEVV